MVLTAAHCVAGDNTDLVVRRQASDSTVDVVAVKTHEDYDSDALKNDIAILFLDRRQASIGGKIKLSPVLNLPGSDLTIIGYGNKSSYGYLFDDDLFEVTVPYPDERAVQRELRLRIRAGCAVLRRNPGRWL